MKRIFTILTSLSFFINLFAFNVNAQNTTDLNENIIPSLPKELEIDAASAILINAETGAVLYEKDAYTKRAEASLTKVMTALLTIENAKKLDDIDKKFEVDKNVIHIEGTSMGLREGDVVTKRALLYGMMLPSGNDAASAAAVAVSGSIDSFVILMNRKAKELGLTDTHFQNPHGLDAPKHYTTAFDFARLCMFAMREPLFAEIVNCTTAKVNFGVPVGDQLPSRTLQNNNKLLRLYDGANGIKTGYTDNAKRTLAGSAERNGVKLITITLNSPDDWNCHIAMFDYGFSKIKEREICTPEYFIEVSEQGVAPTRVAPTEKIVLRLADEEIKNVRFRANVKPFVYAGTPAGEYAGVLEYYYKSDYFGCVPLVTTKPT